MSSSFDDWVSLFDNEIKNIWDKEQNELKKVSMLYCAFFKEIEGLKSTVSDEINKLKLSLKERDFLRKSKNFGGLVNSEPIDLLLDTPLSENKENASENLPIINNKDGHNSSKSIKERDFLRKIQNFKGLVESEPNNSLLGSPLNENKENVPKDLPIIINDDGLNSPNSSELDFQINSSPVLNKSQKKFNISPKNASLYFGLPNTSKKKSPNRRLSTPKHVQLDDSNCVDNSIIESTPQPLQKSKSLKTQLQIKNSKIQLQNKKRNNTKRHNNTLTQMLGEPTLKKNRKKRVIDTNGPSMNIDEIMAEIDDTYISASSSHANDESDATADDLLDFVETVPKNDLKSSYIQKFNQFPMKPQEDLKDGAYTEVVRGKERKKLKGWSCKECEAYYKFQGLSEEELQKKMDECSKHRSKFKPLDETIPGFWDMSFKPSQDSEESLCFFKFKSKKDI